MLVLGAHTHSHTRRTQLSGRHGYCSALWELVFSNGRCAALLQHTWWGGQVCSTPGGVVRFQVAIQNGTAALALFYTGQGRKDIPPPCCRSHHLPHAAQPGSLYGTRSQTALAVWRDGRMEQRERYVELDEAGADWRWQEARHTLSLQR